MANSPEIASRNLITQIYKATDMKKIFNRAEMKRIGDLVVEEMLSDTEAGRSPLTGAAFPAYKNPKKYPGKKKPSRPVNLRLTGQFLQSLKYQIVEARNRIGLEIGFSNRLAALKELGHRNGANRQPKRPLIPRGKQRLREGINKKIRVLIRSIIDKRPKA